MTWILQILGGLFQGLGGWMTKYGSKENTIAREISNENKAEDEHHKAIEKRDIDAVRRNLS